MPSPLSTPQLLPNRAPSVPTTHLSVVVVNWNTRELLLALLRRLAGDPPFPSEILVVDNQSSDGSIEAASAEFPNVIMLPQPRNGGFAYGVNRGLERARGKWVLLFNTDAEASWTEIARFVDEAAAEPDAAIFGPRVIDEHGHPQTSTWRRHLPGHYLPQALFLDRLVRPKTPTTAADVDCVSGCVFLIRTEILPGVGGFDERFFMYFEEADFCERVRRAGHRIRWLPTASFVHIGGLSAGQAAQKTFLAFRESCLLYHAAWHGRWATEWVRACLLLSVVLRLVPWTMLRMVGKGRRAGLYWAAARMLMRPGYVGELCRRARQVPALTGAITADTVT